MVDGVVGFYQIDAQRAQPRQHAILVRSREPAIADDIGDQDRRNFPGLAHGALGRAPAKQKNASR